MPKFFVNSEQINNNEIKIIGNDVNHIKNVLRLSINDKIKICDKDGHVNYNCVISNIDSEYVMTKIIDKEESNVEAKTQIHVFQGLPKGDKLEFIIEKLTEIGVKELTPVAMKRSVVKLQEKDKQKKMVRWNKIAEVAAKQSGRDEILKINDVINYKNIFNYLEDYDIVLLAYEKEEKLTLKKALSKLDKTKENKVAVLIGPEGGFDDIEIEQAKQNSPVNIVTLGKRILRTETAPLVISSNILYELED